MRTVLLVPSLAAAIIGCASGAVNGGLITDGDYAPISSATYSAPECTKVPPGEAQADDKVTYKLVEDRGRHALFEESPSGGGTLITNYWTDADGDHYFTWVTGKDRKPSNGFEYVVSAKGEGTRRVYNKLEIAKGADGVTKPTTPPTYACPLLPI